MTTMAGNTVYVQGNYVDVHDNEVVNLNIDKATVKVQEENVNEGSQPLPEALSTAEAMKYWKRLQELGFVDSDRKLLPDTSRKQAMYIADVFSDKLKLKAKWKPFERLWGIGNLAQEKYKMIETGIAPRRQKDIAKVFED